VADRAGTVIELLEDSYGPGPNELTTYKDCVEASGWSWWGAKKNGKDWRRLSSESGKIMTENDVQHSYVSLHSVIYVIAALELLTSGLRGHSPFCFCLEAKDSINNKGSKYNE